MKDKKNVNIKFESICEKVGLAKQGKFQIDNLSIMTVTFRKIIHKTLTGKIEVMFAKTVIYNRGKRGFLRYVCSKMFCFSNSSLFFMLKSVGCLVSFIISF